MVISRDSLANSKITFLVTNIIEVNGLNGFHRAFLNSGRVLQVDDLDLVVSRFL